MFRSNFKFDMVIIDSETRIQTFYKFISHHELFNHNKDEIDDSIEVFQVSPENTIRIQINHKELSCSNIKILDLYKRVYLIFDFDFIIEDEISFFTKAIITFEWNNQINIESFYKILSIQFKGIFCSLVKRNSQASLYFNQNLDQSEIQNILSKFKIAKKSIIIRNFSSERKWMLKIGPVSTYCIDKDFINLTLKSNSNQASLILTPFNPISSNLEIKEMFLCYSIKEKDRIIKLLMDRIIFNLQLAPLHNFNISVEQKNEQLHLLLAFCGLANYTDMFVLKIQEIFKLKITSFNNHKINNDSNHLSKLISSGDRTLPYLSLTSLSSFYSIALKKKNFICILKLLKTFSFASDNLSPFSISIEQDQIKEREMNNILRIISRRNMKMIKNGSIKLKSHLFIIPSIEQFELVIFFQKIIKILCFNSSVMRIGAFYSSMNEIYLIFIDYIDLNFNINEILDLFPNPSDIDILTINHLKPFLNSDLGDFLTYLLRHKTSFFKRNKQEREGNF